MVGKSIREFLKAQTEYFKVFYNAHTHAHITNIPLRKKCTNQKNKNLVPKIFDLRILIDFDLIRFYFCKESLILVSWLQIKCSWKG